VAEHLAKSGQVRVVAVLTGRRRLIPWRELRDRSLWLPGWSSAPRALVVGAGLAGLTCARELIAAGWEVTLVDKGRGAGGRSSTRRAGALRFDHGAQVITPRDPRFAAEVAAWEQAGWVETWRGLRVRLRGGEVVERLPDCARAVGVPGMSRPIRELAAARGARFGVRVEALAGAPGRWLARCSDGAELGPFEHVAVATPAPQAAPLLEPVAPRLAEAARGVAFEPCWAGLVAFPERPAVPWESAQVEGSPLVWVAHDGSKPGRPDEGPSCWVLHAGPAWSQDHLELDADAVAAALLAAFAELVGAPLPAPVHLAAHRWLYASPVEALGEDCLHDAALGVGLCGDGCLAPRLEGAYLSGLALGEQMLAAVKTG
jgi:predicted NAD/FAD-dependent oxidoreductase